MLLFDRKAKLQSMSTYISHRKNHEMAGTLSLLGQFNLSDDGVESLAWVCYLMNKCRSTEMSEYMKFLTPKNFVTATLSLYEIRHFDVIAAAYPYKQLGDLPARGTIRKTSLFSSNLREHHSIVL